MKIKLIIAAAILSFVAAIFGLAACSNSENTDLIPYYGTYTATSDYAENDITINKNGYTFGSESGKAAIDSGGVTLGKLPLRFFDGNRIAVALDLPFEKLDIEFYTEDRVQISAISFQLNSSVAYSLSVDLDGTYQFIDATNIYRSSSGTYDFKNGILKLYNIKVPALETVYITTAKTMHAGVWVKDYKNFHNEPTKPEYATYCRIYINNAGDRSDYFYKAKKGSTISLPVLEKIGHEFAGWDSDFTITNNKVVVNEDMTFSARWSAKEYTVSLNLEDEINEFKIEYGTSINIGVIEAEGYIFRGWYYNDILFANSNGYMIEDFHYTEDIEIYPAFYMITNYVEYTISGYDKVGTLVYSGGSGRELRFEVSSETDFSAPEITAVPDDGCRFVEWSDGLKTPTRKDTGIKSDFSVSAKIVRLINLNFIATKGGHIEGETVQIIDECVPSATEVRAVADEGYKFIGWFETEIASSSLNCYTEAEAIMIGINSNRIYYGQNYIYAVFEPIKYTVSYVKNYGVGGHFEYNGKAVDNATFTVSPDTNFSAPEITAVPEDGHRFVEWSDGLKTPTRKDINIGSDLIITAIFEYI